VKWISNQKFLTVYSGALTLLVTVTGLSGFASNTTSPTFDTITVQRINVAEPDGTLRMVITNNNRVPGIIFHGTEYPDFGGRKAATTAGVLFYDAQATESGGLTFGGRKDPQGNISRFGHLSFDRYNQDQMFSIDASDDGTNNASTIRLLDQPTWSIEDLLKLEKSIQNLPPDQQQAAIDQFNQTHPPAVGTRTLLSNENFPSAPTASRNVVDFKDAAGHERAILGIDSNAVPSLQILDTAGNITNRFPSN
jgi:hypothetical protein